MGHDTLLQNELREKGHGDLADVLDELERSTTDWWTVPTQWGFTDHSHKHSRRVAKRAEELFDVSEVPQDLKLNLIERFILVAAAWVHDIGMQNADQEDLPADVRSNHPLRSRQLLTSGKFDFKLQDPLLISTIGVIANAHGTSFYRSVLDVNDAIQYLREHEVRVHLLAALLLLSDELDLHNERALHYPGQPDLSKVSAAHWLKHQCIADVRLSDESDGVTINLSLAFPDNLRGQDAAEVEAWIVEKLMIQMVLVDGELNAGYNGKLQMNPRVSVSRRWIDIPNKLVTADVLAVIRAENAKTRLINHDIVFNQAQEHLKNGKDILLVGLGSFDRPLDDGREDLGKALLADAESRGSRVARATSPGSSIRLSASDVLFSWADDLGVETSSGFDDADERSQRGELLGKLLDEVADGTIPVVFALAGMESLSEADSKWLVETALRNLTTENPASAFITSSNEQESLVSDETWMVLSVGKTNPKALRDFAAQFFGRRTDLFKQYFITYDGAKKIKFFEDVNEIGTR